MTTPGTGNGSSVSPGDLGSSPPVTRTATLLTELLDFFDRRSLAAAPQNLIVTHVTTTYLSRLDLDAAPTPRILEQELLAASNAIIKAENVKIPKGDGRLPLARRLSCWQIAQILLRLHHVIRIAPNAKDTDREYDLLAMYNATGVNRGTYTVSEDDLRTTARRYDTQLTLNDFKEVLAILREDSPRTQRCAHRDLLAVNNGIVLYSTADRDIEIGGRTFHFEGKKVHRFDPAIVFLSKSRVDYVEDAPPQVITHPEDGDWEIVAWLEEMFDQPGQEGLADLIWEIIGAIVRPHVRWGKTAWFYSERGNNGKGTLCALMRNLVGDGTHTSIPLSDFGKDFALEPLVRANAIIVDENDVGTLIDKAANLKAIVTGDVIQINRKYRMPIAFQFLGFMVQCLNEFPKAKDKSESFYRRQLFVPFTKSFSGSERKYIKDDYLQRTEVLEYALWYAINRAGAAEPGNYYQLSEPVATKAVLAEYKEVNDPVRSFWEELRELFVWDLLPFPFLYDLFKSWFLRASPSGSLISRQRFVSSLVAIIDGDSDWHCPDKNRKIRPGQMLNKPEPMIAEYELKSWYAPAYKGTDPLKIGKPLLQASYRGLLRHALTATGAAPVPAPGSSPDEP
ncbi:DNA primase family protein [Kribbella catacumbae]|uniref:DNA primase family protein n=1 Tax=Kribbella catacumbae TaxID=460086 RepID=UPI000368A61D|nr:phage/plasmid primase, P4 family [Kribbella catacumbae]